MKILNLSVSILLFSVITPSVLIKNNDFLFNYQKNTTNQFTKTKNNYGVEPGDAIDLRMFPNKLPNIPGSWTGEKTYTCFNCEFSKKWSSFFQLVIDGYYDNQRSTQDRIDWTSQWLYAFVTNSFFVRKDYNFVPNGPFASWSKRFGTKLYNYARNVFSGYGGWVHFDDSLLSTFYKALLANAKNVRGAESIYDYYNNQLCQYSPSKVSCQITLNWKKGQYEGFVVKAIVSH